MQSFSVFFMLLSVWPYHLYHDSYPRYSNICTVCVLGHGGQDGISFSRTTLWLYSFASVWWSNQIFLFILMVDTKWFRGRMVFTKYINILIIHLKDRHENNDSRFLIILFYDLGLSLKPRIVVLNKAEYPWVRPNSVALIRSFIKKKLMLIEKKLYECVLKTREFSPFWSAHNLSNVITSYSPDLWWLYQSCGIL